MWGCSSAIERSPYKGRVTGLTPVSPTKHSKRRDNSRPFSFYFFSLINKQKFVQIIIPCSYRLVWPRTPAFQAENPGSNPGGSTNNELNGFFEANMRDARSASQWFPPEFRPESRGEFAKNESKSGALARTCFLPRRRCEPKISLAQTFFAKRSESEAILSIFCATSSQFWKI